MFSPTGHGTGAGVGISSVIGFDVPGILFSRRPTPVWAIERISLVTTSRWKRLLVT
jgi:hypothetical protein